MVLAPYRRSGGLTVALRRRTSLYSRLVSTRGGSIIDLTDVDQAVGRSQQYFLEDGLWEIVTGIWLALTVAVPAFVGGVVANWSPVVMLLAGLGIRPVVLAAKSRWVFPRTGHVTYPDPGKVQPSRSLGVSPGRAVSGASTGRLDWVWAVSIAGAIAIPLALTRGLTRGDGGFHVAIGGALGAAFLFAAWRWGQRRWMALASTQVALGLLIAASGLAGPTRLAIHAAGIAVALIASGSMAFAGYIRTAPKAGIDDDGR